MTYASHISDYIGYGPATGMTTPTLYPGDSALFYQTDTAKLMQYIYSGWQQVNTGGGGSSWTQLVLNTSAAHTNYNPFSNTASSVFLATNNISLPSVPGVLRLRALVKVISATGPTYFGIGACTHGGTQMIETEISNNGYVDISDVPLTGTGGGTQIMYATWPTNGSIAAGEMALLEMTIAVTSSSQLTVGGNFNGLSLYNTFVSTTVRTNVNLSGQIDVYGIGTASTDIISAYYSTSVGG